MLKFPWARLLLDAWNSLAELEDLGSRSCYVGLLPSQLGLRVKDSWSGIPNVSHIVRDQRLWKAVSRLVQSFSGYLP